MYWYAKTLYKPKFPDNINDEIKEFTTQKLPAFFEYAKDKKQSDDPDRSQVAPRNGSLVNKLYNKIPNKAINTRGLKLGTLEYKYMMKRPDLICSKEISDLYDKLNKQYRYMINMKDEYNDNLRYIACLVRKQFSDLGYAEDIVTDMLVQYLYGNKKRGKQLFWFCFGHYVVKNLIANLPEKKTKITQCIDCGEWFEVDWNSKTTRCKKCQDKERKRINHENYLKKKIQTS